MEVVFHPLVRTDVEEVLVYYRNISPRLADEFHAELKDVINRIGTSPQRFRVVDRGFRRVNFPRFPYHILFELQPGRVRVMLLRHHRRDPRYGLTRS